MSRDNWLDLLVGAPLLLGCLLSLAPLLILAWGAPP
jgi:hypothetical protein